MSETLYPIGYQRQLVTMARLRQLFASHMHPEYARRLFNWIEAQGGHIGIGSSWRDGGAQPDKAGFAPEGKSFHQDQNFNDGVTACAAIDAVARNGTNTHRAPFWSEVPMQGTARAKLWGVHANVGTPSSGESWHIQPVEVDGWQSWWNAGRPSPVRNYPIPGSTPPPPAHTHPTPAPTAPQEVADMIPLPKPKRVYDSREVKRFAAGETRKVVIGMVNAASLHFTVISDEPGFLSVAGVDTAFDGTSASAVNIDGSTPGRVQVRHDTVGVGLPDGHVRIYASMGADVLVDVYETDSGRV